MRIQKGQVRMTPRTHIFPFSWLFFSITCFSNWSSPSLTVNGVTPFSGYLIRGSLRSILRIGENKEENYFICYILALSLDSEPFSSPSMGWVVIASCKQPHFSSFCYRIFPSVIEAISGYNHFTDTAFIQQFFNLFFINACHIAYYYFLIWYICVMNYINNTKMKIYLSIYISLIKIRLCTGFACAVKSSN